MIHHFSQCSKKYFLEQFRNFEMDPAGDSSNDFSFNFEPAAPAFLVGKMQGRYSTGLSYRPIMNMITD